MILAIIAVYNLYMILKHNKLWIPFFFLTAYSFFPSHVLYFVQKTPLLALYALILGYLFHHFKSKYDTSKITFNDKKHFIINADQHFPIGVLFLLKLLQLMPEIMMKANQKLNLMHPEQSMNPNQVTAILQPLIDYMPYINIFAIGFFCSLGIFYIHQCLSLPAKK
jgi:hypothetical protein